MFLTFDNKSLLSSSMIDILYLQNNFLGLLVGFWFIFYE